MERAHFGYSCQAKHHRSDKIVSGTITNVNCDCDCEMRMPMPMRMRMPNAKCECQMPNAKMPKCQTSDGHPESRQCGQVAIKSSPIHSKFPQIDIIVRFYTILL